MPRWCSLALGMLAASSVVIGTWLFVRPDRPDGTGLGRDQTSTTPASEFATNVARSAVPNSYPLGLRVVRDEDGLPIAGARASFAEVEAFGVPPTRITDADGRARWDVPRGVPWTLTVEASDRDVVRMPVGFLNRNLTVRLRKLDAATQPVRKFRSVLVRLVDGNEDVLTPADLGLDTEAALAIELAVSDACELPGDEVDTRTGVGIRREAAFTWTVGLASPGDACVHAVIGDRILGSREVGAAADVIDLPVARSQVELARAPFVVRVIDAKEERGLADAQVTARTPAGFAVTRSTDEHGRARFDDLLAYEFEVETVGSGHCSARRRVQRPVHAEIEMVLQLGREVRGSVVDESGRLMPHSVIGLFRWPSERASEAPLQIATADAEGRFAFTGASRDAIVLAGAEANAEPLLTSATDPWMCFVDAGGDASGHVIRVQQFDPPFPGESR